MGRYTANPKNTHADLSIFSLNVVQFSKYLLCYIQDLTFHKVVKRRILGSMGYGKFAESNNEEILKICQYLAKIWTKVFMCVSFTHRLYSLALHPVKFYVRHIPG